MKLDLTFLALTLAAIPTTALWRVRLYQLEGGSDGPQYTNAGPGSTRWKCHPNVGSMDNKVFYALSDDDFDLGFDEVQYDLEPEDEVDDDA
ncbi:hypothetical protein BJX70DRAFT_393548 [Aspergillus crustosus]